MRPLIQPAIDLIKRAEGFRATAYLCPAGVPTIGYGHTAGVTHADVRRGRTITQAMAEELLRADLQDAQEAVERLVRVSLTDWQYGALVSFTYNVGAGAFAQSRMLTLLNDGDYQGAAEQFSRWCHGGGEVLEGLVKRRRQEQTLFHGGYDLGPA